MPRKFLAYGVAALLLAAPALLGSPPTTRPQVPSLATGSGPPSSFVVKCILRFPGGGGLAGYVATDGRRLVSAMYDPRDWTPLFLSDGEQTLVYDLANSRVVLVPLSRGYLSFDWNAENKKHPVEFEFGVTTATDRPQLDKTSSRFRVDRFVAASAASLTPLVDLPGRETAFVAHREGGNTEALRVDPADPTRFHFASLHDADGFYRLEIDASGVGDRLPATALAFPDLRKLGAEIRVTSLDDESLARFLEFVRDGRAWMAKAGLSAGGDLQDMATKLTPDTDWDELRKRDAAIGSVYRAALSRQGVRFEPYPAPSAKPSTP